MFIWTPGFQQKLFCLIHSSKASWPRGIAQGFSGVKYPGLEPSLINGDLGSWDLNCGNPSCVCVSRSLDLDQPAVPAAGGSGRSTILACAAPLAGGVWDSRIFGGEVILLWEALFNDSFYNVLDSIFDHPQTVYTPNPIPRTGQVEV